MDWRKREITPILLSDEESWFGLRCGKITASEIHKLMKSPRDKKGIFSDSGLTYLHENLAEIINGDSKRHVESRPTEWGKNQEINAVNLLRERNIEIEHFGVNNKVFFPFNEYSGSSPDGLNEEEVFEIKCPYTSNVHVENLIGAKSPDPIGFLRSKRFEYLMQLYFNMICTKRETGVFVSYDPRPVEPRHQLAIIKIPPDDKIIDEMMERLEHAKNFIRDTFDILNNNQ